MHGKDALPILERDEGVDGAPLDQPPAQAGAAMIQSQADRQHEAESTARSHQRERAFQEELIAIGMTASLGAIDARGMDETGEPRGNRSCAFTIGAQAGVAAHHVPRRIAQDGIEATVIARPPVLVVEHLGKFQRPVKEPLSPGNLPRRRCQPDGSVAPQRCGTRAQEIEQRHVDLASGRWPWLPEPAGTPQVGERFPAKERRLLRLQALEP